MVVVAEGHEERNVSLLERLDDAVDSELIVLLGGLWIYIRKLVADEYHKVGLLLIESHADEFCGLTPGILADILSVVDHHYLKFTVCAESESAGGSVGSKGEYRAGEHGDNCKENAEQFLHFVFLLLSYFIFSMTSPETGLVLSMNSRTA